MNILPKTASSDQLGSASEPWGAVYAVAFYANGTELARINRKLDDFGIPDDNADLDATTDRHGLFPKLDKVKLDGIAAGAQVNPTDAAIAASYNSQVSQVSSSEIAAGTGTTVRRFAPADVRAMVLAHALAVTTDAGAVVTAVSAATNNTDSITKTLTTGVLTYDVRRKTTGLASSEALIGTGANGLFVTLGNSSGTAASGADARFPTTDEKAALTSSVFPSFGNPYTTVSGAKLIGIDEFAAPTDNTTHDATTSRHGFMSKVDKIAFDARLPTADEKAAMQAAASPAAGNPFTTVTGAKTIPLDQFSTPSDITTHDATTSRHGFMSKADKIKLDGIAAGAQVNPADAAIATSYNSQVAQVSAGEIAAPTGTTAVRRFSPADIAGIADVRITATGSPWIILGCEVTAGTGGGSASATTWDTRIITTEFLDSGNHCFLDWNQFTLAAGTYDIEAWAISYQVNAFILRLFNVTASAVVSGLAATIGTAAAADSTPERERAWLHGRFILGSSTVLRLEQFSQTAKASDGFGKAITLGSNNHITALIQLWKVA